MYLDRHVPVAPGDRSNHSSNCFPRLQNRVRASGDAGQLERDLKHPPASVLRAIQLRARLGSILSYIQAVNTSPTDVHALCGCSTSLMTEMSSGVVLQHPPINTAPASAHCWVFDANKPPSVLCPSQFLAAAFHCSPELGYMIIFQFFPSCSGLSACSAASPTSSGVQLKPRAIIFCVLSKSAAI